MAKNTILTYLTVLIVLARPWPVRAGNVEKQIEAPVHKAVQIEQTTQATQSRWRDERGKKTKIFEGLEAQIKTLEAQKARQIDQKNLMTAKVAQKRQQLSDIAQISAQISPFLDQLLEQVQALYNQDLPFLQEERTKRLEALAALAHDPEVSVSERFRKIMEALMVEAEYGQTVEVYQQTLDLSGQDTLVNIFRLGRISLFYQTLDKQHCGIYNIARNDWEPLDKDYLRDIQEAVDMGSKRKPVEILDLPLGRIAIQ